MTTPIPCQRHLFDIPDDVHYLNCAYISPLLRAARAAAVEGLERECHPWTIFPSDFFDPLERVRAGFASLVNAAADDIALVPSASYGIATAAANISVEAGQRIVTLEDQYPSNVYAWRELARRRDARLVIVDRPPDGDWTTAVTETIDDATAVVACPNNHWMDGALLDLVRIGEQARRHGSALVLDTSQSLGAMPLDVDRIRPDFMACAGYKWMLGPYSFSYLYVSPERQHGRPLEYNGLNMKDGIDFPRLAQLKDDYAPGARRFDTGERAQFTLAPAAAAALKQLSAWGVDNIYRTLSTMTARVAEIAGNYGLTSMADEYRAGHFIGLRFPGHRYPKGPPAGLPAALKDNNVMLSVRGDSLRVTPHLYNNDADFEALEASLDRALSRGRASN